MKALHIAATGMRAQELNVEVISNNVANMRTTGYKRQRADFQDLLYQNLVSPGAASGQQTVFPSGLQLGLGTRVVAGSRPSVLFFAALSKSPFLDTQKVEVVVIRHYVVASFHSCA